MLCFHRVDLPFSPPQQNYLFQDAIKSQYHQSENNKHDVFQINMLFVYNNPLVTHLVLKIDSINKLTSQCDWANYSAFQNLTLFEVHNKVTIMLKNSTLSCKQSLHNIAI